MDLPKHVIALRELHAVIGNLLADIERGEITPSNPIQATIASSCQVLSYDIWRLRDNSRSNQAKEKSK